MWWLATVVLVVVGIVIISVAIAIAASCTKFRKKCCPKPISRSSSLSTTRTLTKIPKSKIDTSQPKHFQTESKTVHTTEYQSADSPEKSEKSENVEKTEHVQNVENVENGHKALHGVMVVEGGVEGWNRKSRRVLPYSAENETACAESYEHIRNEQIRNGAVTSLSKSVGMARPCDPTTISAPFSFFNRAHKRLFFGVGINYVSQPKNRLTSCWNDIDTLHRTFAARYGSFDRSWIITDRDQRNPASHPSTKFVRATWQTLLGEAARSGNKEVDICFVYSGHGTFRLTTDLGELSGQNDALVFLDQLMYDYEVMAQFVRPLGTNTHLFIVFDSCNSGSAANLPWTYNPLSETVNQTSLHTDLTNHVVMISGCRDEQTSAAGATNSDLSECTRVLTETMREQPSLSCTDLIKTMRAKLVAAQDTQIPQLSMSQPHLLSSLL